MILLKINDDNFVNLDIVCHIEFKADKTIVIFFRELLDSTSYRKFKLSDGDIRRLKSQLSAISCMYLNSNDKK